MFRTPSPRSVASLLLASAALLAPLDAAAQAVDYEALEQVFGEPVTTSVTGKPQRASEAAASLVIITRDDIRRSPARDIPGLIAAYAGIDVARWTAGQTDVVVRGGVRPYNSSLLVLVNGRQAYLDHYGMTNWNLLGVQLDEIQQIEVVRGPNSALFGFNAATGVINIITVNPLTTRQVVTNVEVGNDGQLHLSQTAALKLADAVGVRLSAGYDKSDEFDGSTGAPVLPPNAGPVRRVDALSVAGELLVQAGERTEAGFGISRLTNTQNEIIPALIQLRQDYHFTAADAHVSHDTDWGVLSARTFHTRNNIYSTVANIRNAIIVSNRTSSISANALVRAGSGNTLRFGGEFRANSLHQGYPGPTHYRVLSGSAMWESQLNDRLTITAAGRVDMLRLGQRGLIDQPTIYTAADFHRSITTWSANGAISYRIDDSTVLRIAGGRGVQAPSMLALGMRVHSPAEGMPFPLVFSGNPHIDPAIVTSSEIGLSRELGNAAKLELTAYYNRTRDFVSLSSTSSPPVAAPPAYPFLQLPADNVGSYRALGFTAAIDGRFGSRWSWMANYSWTDVAQDIPANTGGALAWPLALDRTTPRHKVKAQLSYASGPWLATVAARYASAVDQPTLPPAGAPALQLVHIGDNLTFDAKLAFKAGKHLSFTAAGENLTGSAGAGLSVIPSERRVRAGVKVSF